MPLLNDLLLLRLYHGRGMMSIIFPEIPKMGIMVMKNPKKTNNLYNPHS